MAQKIIKIGSSAGVTLSPETLDTLNMRIGDAVDMSVQADERSVTIRPKARNSLALNSDVISWTNQFIDKNRELLKRLADK